MLTGRNITTSNNEMRGTPIKYQQPHVAINKIKSSHISQTLGVICIAFGAEPRAMRQQTFYLRHADLGCVPSTTVGKPMEFTRRQPCRAYL